MRNNSSDCSESSILRKAMLALTNPLTRVFRNHVGLGWQGTVHRYDGGGVFIPDARPLRAGLCEGSSDLIGWRTVEITSEMVGRRLAVFLAVEVKAKRGRLTGEQRNFLQAVNDAGGIGIELRDVEAGVAEVERLTNFANRGKP